jgi:hypothetical protein
MHHHCSFVCFYFSLFYIFFILFSNLLAVFQCRALVCRCQLCNITSHASLPAMGWRHTTLTLSTAIANRSLNDCNRNNANCHLPTRNTARPVSVGLGHAVVDMPAKPKDPIDKTAQHQAWIIKKTG